MAKRVNSVSANPRPGRGGGSAAPTGSTTSTTHTAGGPVITIVTGANGRLESASAKIEKKHIGQGTDTTKAAREQARAQGKPTDDAGHAIGNNLGGPGGATSGNIFPFNPTVNRGEFSQFEQDVADEVKAGKEVEVTVTPNYDNPGDTRPTSVTYTVTVDGETTSRDFDNP
jgi:antitoxin (DNA-binding transcriptional repressor) of toxin-antitoxin stability system